MNSTPEIFADVLFPHPPYQRFTYTIPERFRESLSIGHRVLVPLGKRRVTAFVVALTSIPPQRELRQIEDLLDPYPLMTEALLQLTEWTAGYYMACWGEVIRSALPPGLHRQSSVIIRLKQPLPGSHHPVSETGKRIINLLQNKSAMSLRQIEKRIGKTSIRFHIGKLAEAGFVDVDPVLDDPDVRIRSETWISIKADITPDRIEATRKRAPKQARILGELARHGGAVPRRELDTDFGVLRRLQGKGLIEMWEEEVYRDGYDDLTIPEPEIQTPNADQQCAVDRIRNAMSKKKFHALLLHGVTGSGKTLVYIECIRHALMNGQTALVLIPEISLTPQAVARYRSFFPDDVAVLHSRMSPGERFDAWRRLREGKKRIAIGPRSAVFAPLQDIGLIVVDEEHVDSYKQEEPAPRYHARDVAVMRAKYARAVIVLGSATPSLESYNNAIAGKYGLCELPERIDSIPLPQVRVIRQTDTEHERSSAVFSRELREAIEERWKAGEQIIILQNRRGYAPFLICGSCGAVPGCPRCEITLTYHRQHRHMRCHYCGFQSSVPDVCPVCGGSELRYRGLGTQRVEEELRRLFPGLELLRMDQDTTRRKGAHSKILYDFAEKNAVLLLGTQMVAKGHDFPGVSLVGIVNADTGLHFPDFRSSERTFQLLTQAAGRSGRKSVGGIVIVQTDSPDHPALRFAAMQDYTGFYSWESEQRKSLNYPPWGRLIMVLFRAKDRNTAIEAARRFAGSAETNSCCDLLGPSPAPLARIRNLYRVQVILRSAKSKDPAGRKLRETVRKAVARYRETERNPDVRVSVNVDPVNML